jgi:NTE family protein
MTSSDPVYGLVCAGGGAHGAYQVGVLKYIHEHFCDGEVSPFRVFSGTSAGSLNTSFLAAQSFDARSSRLWMEEMWLDFHVPAYHGNVVKNSILTLLKEWAKPRSSRKPTWSLLDPTPLHDIVAKGIVRENFERAMQEGTTLGLAVSATELKSSRLVWFQEGPEATSWVVPESIAIETRLGVPHIQASCSVPIAFPPVRIGEHDYADGGVANKRPFTPAINMGATRILSIATDQPLPHHLPEYPPDFKPRFADTLKMLLDQMSHDYAVDQASAIEAFNYFCAQAPAGGPHPAFRHILLGRDIHLSEYRPVEIHLFAPSRRISSTDIFNPEVFDEALESKSTVLLFHKDFIRPLIDFGYEDAKARHRELAEFFDRDRPQRPSQFEEVTTGSARIVDTP